MCRQNPTEVQHIKMKDANQSSNTGQEIRDEIALPRYCT